MTDLGALSGLISARPRPALGNLTITDDLQRFLLS